jgi:hypothetical protein
MSVLRFSQPPLPAHMRADLQESRRILQTMLKGRRIVVVTEDRYIQNQAKLFARLAEAIGAEHKLIPYSEFLTSRAPLKGDVLLLRTSKLFITALPEILSSIEQFRKDNPHSAILACILNESAFDAFSSRPGLVNVIDAGVIDNDMDLLRKGAEVLERLS